MSSDRRGSFRPQPKDTVPYEVQPSDTLESIAARYNITPSELMSLNKLATRTVFPGQIIYIPEKNSLQVFEQILKENNAAVNSSSSECSPKPGHVERVPGGSSSGVVDDSAADRVENDDGGNIHGGNKDKLHDDNTESLKINSKYVTDGEGVVSGVLIVTRNHIVFDPNIYDPLVIEYGIDKYGVEASMGYIVKAALYTDIFRIKKDSSISLYHSKNKGITKSKSTEEELEKTVEQNRRYSSADAPLRHSEFGSSVSRSFQEQLSKICESTDDAEEAVESSSEPLQPGVPDEKDTTDEKNATDKDQNSTVNVLSSTSSIDSEDGLTTRKESVSDDAIISFEPLSPRKKSSFEKTKNKIHKGFKRLSITDSLFSSKPSGRRMSLPVFSSLPDFKLKSPIVKSVSSVKSLKSPEEHKATPSGPTYVNMVEDKPELFAPLDKLIPRPAKSFCDIPLYLCLRMGLPLDKSIPRPHPVVHFGQKMKPEYWFTIPKDNVDSLYHFFLRWYPEKYGEIDNLNYEELGYLRIESEETSQTEVSQDNWLQNNDFSKKQKPKSTAEKNNYSVQSSPEDWEFLDCIGLASNSILIPELLTPSTILTEEQTIQIAQHLPARAMNSWSLIYGTAAHGFSLKTMYRKMTQIDSPVLIVIKNRNNEIFGALLSSPLKLSDHFYGTGESFLFTFSPSFKVYRWSGENSYFIKGNIDSFMVGSSEGHFGLWLDDDLFRGRTNSCETFSNDPLCAEQDFEVKTLEAWGFV